MPFAAVAMLAPTVAAAQIAFAGSAGLGLPGGTAFEDARTGDRTTFGLSSGPFPGRSVLTPQSST